MSADGGEVSVASDSCDGQPLRGPNDLTLDPAGGGFYFTDPGESSAANPIGTVHHVDSRGKTTLAADGLAFPNGIVLAPDGKKLYLAESHHNRVWVYEVEGPGRLGGRKLLCDLPRKDEAAGQIDNQPDGMCLDANGNLYVAHYGMGQVQVLDRQGTVVRRYETGLLLTSNVAFGGPDHDMLYVTGAVDGSSKPGGVAVLNLHVPGRRLLSSPPGKQ